MGSCTSRRARRTEPAPDRPAEPPKWRWEAKRNAIVTDDGATIDFYGEAGATADLFGKRGRREPTILTREELSRVTDDDVICLLTPGVVRVVLRGCANLTDAAITAVADKCPNLEELYVSRCGNLMDAAIRAVAMRCKNLAKLNVSWCHNLTDVAITAVANNCPKFAQLNVSKCVNLTDAAITAVAENCPNLVELYFSGCTKVTDAAITVVAERCAHLAALRAHSCGLTALPDTMGSLSKLKILDLNNNELTELPRSIAELDATCRLDLYGNPLQKPPREVAEQGIPAIRRYFEQLKAGAIVATQLKIVLCGDGGAGKTSLRNAFAGRPNPRQAPDARTIHLDRESVRVPVVKDDDKVKELTFNFVDLGGQENYVYAQAPFLTKSALFVLVVEVLKACPENADAAVLRFITLIQTRVADATVLPLVSKIDELEFDDDGVERCDWLLRVVNERLAAWREAVQRRNEREGKPDKVIPLIHAEKPVLTVTVGEELKQSRGVVGFRDAVAQLARSSLFPTVGQEIPTSWFEVWQFLRAIAEHGDENKAIEAMLKGTAIRPLGVDDMGLSAEGAYRPINELRAAWSIYCEHVERRGDPDAMFFDALQLLEAQGGFFVDAGLAFLQPRLIIDLIKPLVDQTLTMEIVESDDFQKQCDNFVASHTSIVPDTLRNQVVSFAHSGELGPVALVFLWRGLPHVKHEHYGQILQILHRSGVIFVQEKENQDQVAVVFAHLPPNVPDAQLANAWPESRPTDVSQSDMNVKFYSGGCPAAFLQRIVAAMHRFGVSLCAWRKGVVVYHRDGTVYVRLVNEDSPVPTLVFSVRMKSGKPDPRMWFSRVIELLRMEAERLPGMDCGALVCCSSLDCPRNDIHTVVWASKREYNLSSDCKCGTPLLGKAPQDRRASNRALLELLVQKADRTYGAVQKIPAAIKESRDAILNTMVELANGASKYPSLFYVVPVPSSSTGGLMRPRSFFEEEMMIVFVCAESKRSVLYDGKPGLKFSVLRRSVRTKVVAAATFWRKYGRIAQVAASLLTTAVNAAVNVKLEDLVPKEVSSVVGAVTTKAEFIEKYAGMISDAVDKGMQYVDMVEKLEKQRSRADSAGSRDGVEDRVEDENIEEMKQEYDDYLQEFLDGVRFDRSKLPMEYRQLQNGTMGWALKRRA
ncbi:hypothetical protein CTAYLR_009214 [Chrysophaeum taylorii]|uniref:F-box/LRR-repeat protein 15-like leucin rich repeat domain-containing protein n=1 Tax=Chrysophaeum taylorii TaxID=2483200 RepID=A0AAD7U943_9STRA|nr:hypothetical protein CTAYLR_009214 [Chrysophaeum taylorii]